MLTHRDSPLLTASTLINTGRIDRTLSSYSFSGIKNQPLTNMPVPLYGLRFCYEEFLYGEEPGITCTMTIIRLFL
ncbi:MAG: hypothetical protein A3K90_04115 [Pelodictyon luteolum]|uniref:Uncharacterized protein n=1 Tax=Pelodictyon luteolum TaxID=1100 RepID=A0A165MBF7_PELLU|nr:MAG: hypothetical protein A3K90_04115 [Pelodictyon luteolum]